tara:strand:- start:461 stop:832 length:372 start_codon:yes stop_codon:yes gene_type:complete
MTIYVKENTEDMAEALSYMETAMIEDYNHFMDKDNEIHNKMRLEFATGIEVLYGSKYIKIVTGKHGGQRSVWGFIVNTDKDKKFKKGDLLKAAGWAAPARNAARGNILEGGYAINWTGPLYLK